MHNFTPFLSMTGRFVHAVQQPQTSCAFGVPLALQISFPPPFIVAPMFTQARSGMLDFV